MIQRLVSSSLTRDQIRSPNNSWHIDVDNATLLNRLFGGRLQIHKKTNGWLYVKLFIERACKKPCITCF